MPDSFVIDAIRTPIGRYAGSLSGVRPDDLAAHVLKTIVERDGIDPETIDDVFFGDANAAGEDNRDVARMASLLAGLPTTVTGVTLNRLCGSGLEAAIGASRAIEAGDASLTIAGGVESMSRAPWVQLKPAKGFPAGHETLYSTTLGWRMVNPDMPDKWTIALGESAEILADRYEISREQQDAFAVKSHQRAHAAWQAGFYDDHVIALPDNELTRDEGIRPDSSTEKLAKLRPAFRKDGTVTAGNASPLSDGAGALVIGDQIAADRLGRAPMARIAARAVHGVDPDIFGIAPVEAANKALARAGIGWDDLAVVELNEAFASQSLACLADWKELDPEIVNPNGGAIAIGHPLGCSGVRILGTLAHALRRRGGGWGLAAICIGVGQGLAVVLEA